MDERFWAKVNKTEGCWEWTGNLNYGYGSFSIGGRKENRPMGAHRFSYELVHGKLPNGISVLHRCDNRKCVNPDHLFTGTQQDNVRDMVEKNRQAKGCQIASSVLNDEQVSEIRRRFTFGRQVISSLAREFNVDHSTIRRVRDNATWRHI